MATTTARKAAAITQGWTDLITSIPEAASQSGFLKHIQGMPVEVIKGGVTQPSENDIGVPLYCHGEEWCEADHIWLRCRSRSGATVMFVATEA